VADVKLVTKFVDLSSAGGPGFALYGFRNIGGTYGSFGTLSETTNGSSNTTTSYLYSTSTDIKEIYWSDTSTDTLYFTLDGNRSNSAFIWTELKIGTTTFTRSSASYSYNSSTDRTTWSWATNTNPFGSTTTGTDVAIEVILDVNTGHTTSPSGNRTITASSTSDDTFSISNASSNQKYRLIKTSGTIASGGGTGTVIDSRVGNGSFTIDYSNNELPPAGNNATYQLQVSGGYVSDTENESGFWINTTGQSNSFTITREAAATPTYSLAASPTTVNEGSSVTFTVSTTNVAQGTTLYFRAVGVPSGSSAGNSDYSPLTGSDTVDSNGQATFTTTVTADNTTEGTEYFRGQVFTDSSYSNQVGSDATVTINDTSTTPAPTYSVSGPSSINEGSTGTFTVSTTNVTNGTDLYWSLVDATDFNTATGTVEITNNTGQFDVTPTADQTTEGAETGTIRVRTGSQGGTIVATDTFTINDTSTTPTGSFDLSTDTITEGGSLTVQNISTSPSGGYHLKLFRNSGDSPDSISPVTKTWTGTSTADFTMSVANQSASEIGYQGESFTWLLREGTDTSAGWNGGASLDSADFTLYDDEHGTSISDSTIDISYSATSFTVGVISNWSGTNTVAARIRNTSTNTVVKTFNITTNNGTTNVSVTSGLPAATSGSSSNYRVEVYNGNEYLNGATFSVTRGAADTTPNDFSFTDFTNVARSTTQTSSTITVGGLSTGTSVAVSVTGGTYSKNSGSYTSSNGTASNGDTFSVRHTSSGSFSTNTDTTLTIGNKDDTFRTTTLAADTVPDAFSFTDATNQPLGALTTSTEITIAGLNTSTTVSVTGGEYSKNEGTYTSSNGTASNGDTFTLRHTTSLSYSTPTNTELNIGGETDTWTTTTIAEGTTQTGGGGGTSTGSGNYGIEVYGPDGETVVWGSNVRQSNIVVYELLDLDNGTSKSYTCADANDDTKVKVVAAMPSYISGPAYQNFYGGISVSKTSTGFTVTNSNSDIVEPSVEILVIAARVA